MILFRTLIEGFIDSSQCSLQRISRSESERFKFSNERDTSFMTSIRFSSCFIRCADKRESHTGNSTLEQENDTDDKFHGCSSRNYICFREEKANKKWALEHECFRIHIVFFPRSWAQAKGFCTDSLLGKWSKGARVANVETKKRRQDRRMCYPICSYYMGLVLAVTRQCE